MESKENRFEDIDFQKYWLVLQRRFLPAIGVFGVCVISAIFYTSNLKSTYTADASLLIKTNRTSSFTGLGKEIGQLEPLTLDSNPLETQAKIVTSAPVIKETVRALNLKKELPGKLKVGGVKGTDLLEISYTDKDPQLAAKVVNKLIEIYINSSVQANRAEAISARKFISAQLPRSEAAVRQAESALREFKEKNKVIVLQEEATTAVNTVSKLSEEISQAQAQLVDITARLENLQKEAKVNGEEAVLNAELSKAPGVQKVLEQLQEAESLLAVEQSRFQTGHPTLVNLEAKVASLKRLLQDRIDEVAGSNQKVSKGNLQVGDLRQDLIGEVIKTETERLGLQRRIAQLSNTLSAYKQKANELPKLEQIQRELERRLKAAQVTYETLLTKLQEIQVAENQSIGYARVISYASVPEDPDSSRKIFYIAGGAVVGILLGIIVAFALDLIDGSVKTVKEAKELFRYTLLGVIPDMSRNGKNSGYTAGVDRPIPQVIGRDIPHFPVGDAYQILQANLKFLSSDREIKAIVITSSVTKEGKSEVAANLAVAMATVGHRVLLVDADLRHPMQHHIWGLTNAVGLSNIIVDQLSTDTLVREVMPNLDVITSGVLPPNPVALLDSNRMATLVDIFTNDHDYVIFDTPTLAGTADAAVLSKLADGTLLVVRPGLVDFASGNSAKEFLTQSGQKVLGMVINGVNVKREPDSYFYYTRDQAEPSSASRKSASTKQNSIRERA